MTQTLATPNSSGFRLSSAQLVRAQAVSGSLFFIFLILHISNTLIAPFGYETYNHYQSLLRGIYHHPAFELTFVVLPLIVHAIAGVVLYKRRGRRRQSVLQRFNTWAGFILLSIIFIHVAATRGIGLLMDAAPGFEGVSFALWWMPAFFYPYYFLLLLAGLYHAWNGISMVGTRIGLPRQLRSDAVKKGLLVTGSLWAMIVLLSFDGQLFSIPDPTDNDYARAYGSMLTIDFARE